MIILSFIYSRVLRKAIEPIKITQLDKEERQQIEEDFQVI